MPTITYDQLAGLDPSQASLAKATGLVGYTPLNREVAPVAFNPFTYGQASGDQPTEAAMFRKGIGSTETVYPGMENMPFSFQMKTNKGRDAGTFTVSPNQNVRIINRATGEVYYEGSGIAGAVQAAQIGRQLSQEQGKKANWKIETSGDGNSWTLGAQDKKAKQGLLGTLADIALPVLGAALMPLTGGMSAALAAGLGAAGGSALSGALQGRSIGSIAKGAALSGLTAGIGSGIAPAISGATGLSAAAGKGIGYGLANTAGGLVQGQSLGDALKTGAISGLGAYGMASLMTPTMNASNIPSDLLPANGITFDPSGAYTASPSMGGGFGGTGLSAAQIASGNYGGSISGIGNLATAPTAPVSSGIFGSGVSLGDAGKYAQLGSLGLSALGGLLPQGQSNQAVSMVPTTGYSPTGAGVGDIIAAPAYTGPTSAYAGPAYGVASYAEGGETESSLEDDTVKHLMEYHRKGGHDGPGPVKGEGTGQDDKIPAWLSDGEYVWSAQDVADLGDGSTDAGVRKLDQMRQMVRKQAGRKNVKKIAKPQKGIEHMLKAVGGAA